MKLQYQLNLLAITILICVSAAIASAGFFTINNLTMELNSRLLSNEVGNVMGEIRGAHQILKESRVDQVQSYVDRAQTDLLQAFEDYRFGRTGQLVILDAMTKERKIPSDLGFSQEDLCIEKMLKTRTGVYQCQNAPEPFLMGYDLYPEWQWLVVVLIGKKEVMEARNRFMVQAALILGGSVAAGILLFVWFSGRVIRPVRQLTAAAESISRGEWEVPFPDLGGGSEVAQLTAIFRKMAQNLSDMYRQLKQNLDNEEKAKEALHLSREQFRGLVETTNDLVWEVNNKGEFTYVSPQVTALLGFRPKDLMGKTPEVFHDISNGRQEQDRFMDLLSGGLSFSGVERHLQKKDGGIVVMESSGVLFADPAGNKLGFRGIDRDITERKKALSKQQNLQEQLIQAQKMEAIGRLAGGVAHDFNNMLSVIIGHAEMGLETLSASQPQYADFYEIKKAAERSAGLTRHLLTFARKQTVDPQIINLNDVITEMSAMLKRLIGEDIDFSWIPGKWLWQVKLDTSQVDQILANLCVNGRDAIAGVGKITVETSNVTIDEEYCKNNAEFFPGEYVCLSVSDNGCGMDHEIVSHIFEPFFTTKDPGKGTGLGLSTIYGIIRQNQGFVHVYSEPGHGSVFKLYFKRHKDGVCDAKQTLRPASVPRGTETILLVEDEEAILKMTTALLEKNGYNVLQANTPDQAIETAKETGRIDLLLTDVVLPEMNGRDLAGRITALHPSILCVYMSGYTANVIAHHGVLDEGVDFIAKPFTVKALLTKIRSVLDNGGMRGPR